MEGDEGLRQVCDVSSLDRVAPISVRITSPSTPSDRLCRPGKDSCSFHRQSTFTNVDLTVPSRGLGGEQTNLTLYRVLLPNVLMIVAALFNSCSSLSRSANLS